MVLEKEIDLKNTFKSIAIIATCFLLIAKQPDLGTSLVVSMAGIYILFFAGLSWKFIGSSFLIFIIFSIFVKNRKTLNPHNSTPRGSFSGENAIIRKLSTRSSIVEGRKYLRLEKRQQIVNDSQ